MIIILLNIQTKFEKSHKNTNLVSKVIDFFGGSECTIDVNHRSLIDYMVLKIVQTMVHGCV